MSRTKNVPKLELEDAKYSKDSILRAERLDWNKDLLKVILDDDKEYTLDEVETLVKEFNSREVK
ncbi:hypothetical protein SAMN00017477_1025 [Peptoniphilus asaccharolyticus DSM 20463]|uniref:Uncharacterized protein n=1 Tax=Peptoniphilus asaccharolyticus DSM 20463 TaxID=573058 RepID=A0A1W1V1G6_PEPAS|nr:MULTISPECIES: hypothetical protein [Peptoniphilus]MBL7575521.1 hypothetical protein [Peptoniphilus asaccharolyticus]MDY2987685.1 hypothetical protein [Peptoniphilus sp.]SMB87133.1 hypothetical protein SAMN00017477_1025 [Peptoniphilus asaccharolyticus DSM 20463]